MCNVCKAKIQNPKPVHRSLPSVRSTPAHVFLHSRVVYAGLINIRTSKERDSRSQKDTYNYLFA